MALKPKRNAVMYWDSRVSRVRRRESGLARRIPQALIPDS
jgi:hypothetical protein